MKHPVRAELAFHHQDELSCTNKQRAEAIFAYVKATCPSTFLEIFNEFSEKGDLSEEERFLLQISIERLPKTERDFFFDKLYQILKPSLNPYQDDFSYAQDAFYGKNGLSSSFNQNIRALKKCLTIQIHSFFQSIEKICTNPEITDEELKEQKKLILTLPQVYQRKFFTYLVKILGIPAKEKIAYNLLETLLIILFMIVNHYK